MAREFCAESIMFYLEVNALRTLKETTRSEIEYIVSEYILEDSPLQVNISYTMSVAISKYMTEKPDGTDAEIFAAAQSEIFELMNQNNFQSYVRGVHIKNKVLLETKAGKVSEGFLGMLRKVSEGFPG
eukprot:768419_1